MYNITIILSSSLLASVYLTSKLLKILNEYYRHDPPLLTMCGFTFGMAYGIFLSACTSTICNL